MTKEKYDEIVTFLRKVIKNTTWEGKVYTVGGCLRDALMDNDIHDVDLAVNTPNGGVTFPIWLEKQGLTLSPPTLYRRFSSSRLHLKAFPEDEIEVVQTRREQYTDENSRNPEVCFGSLQDDCERRDLTINSLYQNVSSGEVLDLTGRGIDDIKNHRIQTPMKPSETYKDDPIRILRTLRFAVKYGWVIPDDLWEAMKNNAGRMKIVRRPRIRTEFEKMILSNDPVKLMKMMKDLGVIFRVIPELCHLYRLKDHSRRKELGPNAPLPTLWDITMHRLSQVVGSENDSPEARYAALFSQFKGVRISYSVVSKALKRLLYEPEFIRRVKSILNSSGELNEEAEENIYRMPRGQKRSYKKNTPRKKNDEGWSKSRRRRKRKRNDA